MHGIVSREHVQRTGPALASIRMSISRFNATLHDGQAYGLPVDAIPLEGITPCTDMDN